MQNRKSRNAWSNRRIWRWSTEWIRAKANRVLPREWTGHSKHPLPTTQEKTLHRDITRWSTAKSDWLYSLQPKMEKLYKGSKNKTGSWLWPRSWTPYCEIQKLKKVGETIRPFSSVQFSSVAQSCPTLCDPMNRSTPGLPVHHRLLEFIHTHVHWVGDAIQPSHPLPPSSPFAFNFSFPASESFPVSHLFTSGGQSFRASASASVLAMNIQGWLSLGLIGLIF